MLSQSSGNQVRGQRFKRLEDRLAALPNKCLAVVRSTRLAALKQDGIKAYSHSAHKSTLSLQATNLAVLAEYLAPMVFKLLVGLVGSALLLAGVNDPVSGTGAHANMLLASVTKVAGTLLRCQQEVGEKCAVEVAKHAKGAEKYTNELLANAARSEVQAKKLIHKANKENKNMQAAIGACVACAVSGIFAAGAGDVVGPTIRRIAGLVSGCCLMVSYKAAEGFKNEHKKLLSRSKSAKVFESAAFDASDKGLDAVDALNGLKQEQDFGADASNSTVTGLLATALLEILRDWELIWDSVATTQHISSGSSGHSTSSDPELVSQLGSLLDSIKVAETEWNTKVQGSVCGLAMATGRAADQSLLVEFLDKNRNRLAQAQLTVGQAQKFINDINNLPGGSMASHALGAYCTNNAQLLLGGVNQTVPQLLQTSDSGETYTMAKEHTASTSAA